LNVTHSTDAIATSVKEGTIRAPVFLPPDEELPEEEEDEAELDPGRVVLELGPVAVDCCVAPVELPAELDEVAIAVVVEGAVEDGEFVLPPVLLVVVDEPADDDETLYLGGNDGHEVTPLARSLVSHVTAPLKETHPAKTRPVLVALVANETETADKMLALKMTVV